MAAVTTIGLIMTGIVIGWVTAAIAAYNITKEYRDKND